MKILLFGKNGQLGHALQRVFQSEKEMTAVDRYSLLCGDLSNPEGILKTIQTVNPDVVINAAAYTAVDQAETELAQARKINALAPGIMAQEMAKRGGWMIHYSTDYVFDGSATRPCTEKDEPNPCNAYGLSKLEGDRAVQKARGNHLIFRTSWVYSAQGHNFVKTILQRARTQDILTVVSDQQGTPTPADWLAEVTQQALNHVQNRPELHGLYHVTPQGETTWHAFAEYIVELARQSGIALQAREIQPVSSSTFASPARRPARSRLDCSRLCETFGFRQPSWREGVIRIIKDLKGQFS